MAQVPAVDPAFFVWLAHACLATALNLWLWSQIVRAMWRLRGRPAAEPLSLRA